MDHFKHSGYCTHTRVARDKHICGVGAGVWPLVCAAHLQRLDLFKPSPGCTSCSHGRLPLGMPQLRTGGVDSTQLLWAVWAMSALDVCLSLSELL